MPARARRRLSRAARRAVALAVLAGVAVGTVGFPVTPPDLARGGAYPCQGHGCGCGSAEQCWFGCCCLTAAERLAWAERHGVTPPDGVVFLAEAEGGPAVVSDLCGTAATEPACCAGAESSSCAGYDRSCCPGGDRSCCAGKATAAVAERSKPTPPDGPTFTSPRCRGGLGHWWIASGQPLTLPDPPVAVPRPAGVGIVVLETALYDFSAAPPAARPG